MEMTKKGNEGRRRYFTAKALEDIELLALNIKVKFFFHLNRLGIKRDATRISTYYE
jgi:hypothetical protein